VNKLNITRVCILTGISASFTNEQDVEINVTIVGKSDIFNLYKKVIIYLKDYKKWQQDKQKLI
jgi:hypothetical protein